MHGAKVKICFTCCGRRIKNSLNVHWLVLQIPFSKGHCYIHPGDMGAAVTLLFQIVPIYRSQPTVIYMTLITKTIYTPTTDSY